MSTLGAGLGLESGSEVKKHADQSKVPGHVERYNKGDAKPKTEAEVYKPAIKKYVKTLQVFIAASSKNPEQELPGLLDVDYTQAVINNVEAETAFNVVPIQGMHNEKEIFSYIDAKKNTSSPILHLHLNVPNVGTAFTLEGLGAFVKCGGKLVITALDFFKYSNEDKKIMLQYLSLANTIVFLDDVDKEDAIHALTKITIPESKHLGEMLAESIVAPCMPTVPVYSRKHSLGNIISMGALDSEDRFNHILKLARLIQKSKEIEINTKKIILIGTVQELSDSKNQALFKMLAAGVYLSKKTEIEGKNIKELKALLKTYHQLVNDKKINTTLPIELHLEPSIVELQALFEQCTYAFFPNSRGATFKNSHIINAINNGLVVYSHQTQFTPKCLLQNSEYRSAMVLMETDNYGEDKENDCDFNGYTSLVVEDILKRSKSPSLDLEATDSAKRLFENLLSPANYLGKFSKQYRTMLLSENKDYLAFLELQANFNAKRSYAKFKAIQGIDIKKQDIINFDRLRKNLRTVTGSLRDAKPFEDMQKFLQEKLKGNILTPEEKRVFQLLVKSPWFIKHVTPHYAEIRQGGHRLMSLDQRQRMGDKISNGHTMPSEGNTDNVFLSMNPGSDYEAVRFLDSVTTEVLGDVSLMRENGASALKGTWSSGHIFAFINEQDGEPVKIFSTLYRVRYRKYLNDVTEKIEWVKECVFTQPDGKEIVQVVSKEDEIFLHPRIEIAVALMTIEKFRLMGINAWKNIMKSDVKTLQEMVQVIFHSGMFEVHKPAHLLLDEPGVSVVKRKAKTNSRDNIDIQIMRPLIEAALLGDVGTVVKHLRDDLPLDTSVLIEGYSLNLLAAAILGGHLSLVTELLERGVNVHKTDVYLPKGTNKEGRSYPLLTGPLGFVALLSNPQYCKRAIKTILGDKQKQDIKIQHEIAINIAELLIDQGSKYKKNKNISRPVILSGPAFINILNYLRPDAALVYKLLKAFHGKGGELPLVEAIYLQMPEVVELFIKCGADVNNSTGSMEGGPALKNTFKPLMLLPEVTPLIAAIKMANPILVKLLVHYKANVNQAYTAAKMTDKRECSLLRLTDNEGCSPLMMAVKQGSLEICSILLKAGADISHRSCKGATAFSLAEAAKRADILKLLKNYLKPLDKYPLHVAAKASDWEACKTIIQDGLADLSLNNEGQSAYDINPALLKQSFIPVQRQIESYQSALAVTNIIFIFKDRAGQKYFRLFKPEVTEEAMPLDLLPFMRVLLQNLTNKNTMQIFSSLNFSCSEKDFVLKRLGTLTVGFQDKEIFHIENIVSAEFGPDALERQQALTGAQNFVLIPSEKVIKFSQEQSISKEALSHEGYEISRITTLLLKALSTKEEISEFSKKQLEEFHEVYREERAAGYKLINYAKQGDLDAIEKVLKQSGISVNMSVPTLENVDENKDLGRLKKYYGNTDVAIRAALYAGQIECAYQLAEKYKAKFPGLINDVGLDYIIQKDHVGLFRLHHEFVNKLISDTKTALHSAAQKALKHSKLEIVKYLVSNNIIEGTPEDIIVTCARYLSVDVVKILLPKTPSLKKMEDALWQTLHYYEKDVNDKTLSGTYHDHLSIDARDLKVVEMVKLLSSFLYDTIVSNILPALSGLKLALRKHNLPLLMALITLYKCTIEHERYLEIIFDDYEKELKENAGKVYSMLARLVDPKGCWSLIVPAVNRLVKSKEASEKTILENVEQLYQKNAPEVLEFRNALQTNDTKKVMEFLSKGFEINSHIFSGVPSASLFVGTTALGLTEGTTLGTSMTVRQTVDPPFTSPLKIALKAKSFDVAKILIERGAPINGNNGVLGNDIEEIIKAGHAELLLLLKKKEQALLGKRSLILYDLVMLAGRTNNAPVLQVFSDIDCVVWEVGTLFDLILKQSIESGNTDSLQVALSKTSDFNLKFSYPKIFSSFSYEKEFLYFSCSKEDRFKLLENSCAHYQVAKCMLRHKGANFLSSSPNYTQESEAALLYLWGIKHEKDIIELFEIMLNTPQTTQKIFFAECWRMSLRNLDFKQITWLLRYRENDLKNDRLLISSSGFTISPAGSVLDYLLKLYVEKEVEWKDKTKEIEDLVMHLRKLGAEETSAQARVQKIENKSLRATLLRLLETPVVKAVPITTGFDMHRVGAGAGVGACASADAVSKDLPAVEMNGKLSKI